MLNKVKKLYLLQKVQIVGDKPVSEIEITDEDLVPLELFDHVLAEKEHKYSDRKSYLVDLIAEAKSKSKATIDQMGADSLTDKTKKIVENSVFIAYLNQRLEVTHTKVFTYNYTHQLLHYQFKV